MRLKPDIHTKESAFEKLTGTKYTFNLFKKTESYENNTTLFENMQCYIKNQLARNFDKKYFGPFKIIRQNNNNTITYIDNKQQQKTMNLRNVKLIKVCKNQ